MLRKILEMIQLIINPSSKSQPPPSSSGSGTASKRIKHTSSACLGSTAPPKKRARAGLVAPSSRTRRTRTLNETDTQEPTPGATTVLNKYISDAERAELDEKQTAARRKIINYCNRTMKRFEYTTTSEEGV